MSPIYDYACECGMEWEEYNDIANRDNEMCQCGKPAKRILKATNAKPVVLEYYSESLGMVITGPKQKQQVLKEKNLREVDRVVT